jgi:rhomboid protease GluP
LFHIVLGEYPKTVQKFWLLTALMFAGKQKVAREQILTLRLQGDLILSNAIDWRLCHPLIAPTEVLEKRSWKILARIKSNITRDVNRDQFFKNRQSKPYITSSLIGINLIFYFIEIAAGGGENLRTIYQLGALVPKEVIGGDWWRMITSNFLHYGWWHLLTNMIGLYFIGRFLESALSRIQYLLIYFISGIGSMFLFSLCTVLIGDSRQILVGASAAIMGLIGAMLSLFWRDWWRHRSRYSLQRLQILLSIIFLQFGIDFIFPNISFLSHIGGLIIGFLIANLFVSSKYTNY